MAVGTKDLVLVGALVGGLYVVSRLMRDETASGQGVPTGSGGIPVGANGEFDPALVDLMPDYKRVTELVSESGPDFFYDGMPPTAYYNAGYINQWLGSPGRYKELYDAAAQISLASINVLDMRRAGEFLDVAWREGPVVGAKPTRTEEEILKANGRLEGVASGLDIGSQIGIGLAAAFSFGAAAEASDSSFGFGRGAAEERAAIIDLADIPIGGGGLARDLAFGNTYTFPLENIGATDRNPSGMFQKPAFPTTITAGGGRVIPVLPNLFRPNLVSYDDHWSDQGLSFQEKIHAASGVDYVPIGFVFPWRARQMGCYLPTRKKRVYIAARMLRVLDLIICKAYPQDPAQVMQGTLIPNPDGSGGLIAATGNLPVTYAYDSVRFGSIRGSIFPRFPGDGYELGQRAAQSTLAVPAGTDPGKTAAQSTYSAPVAPSGGTAATSLAPTPSAPASTGIVKGTRIRIT